jgi:dsDNA-specific endonuclease/ATPase MutS2
MSDPPHEPPDSVVLPITDTLDLHFFQPRDTADVVRAFLDEAWSQGLRELRLVHGRGIGTQRNIVRQVLASDQRVRSFADAPGNWGATVVELNTCGETEA